MEQANSPYTLAFTLSKADFPPNEDLKNMIRLNLALKQERAVKVPLELEFIPEGQEVGQEIHYVAQQDYDWDKAQNRGGPISLMVFDQKIHPDATPPEPNPILTTLSPFGRWRITIRTDVDHALYAELFKGATMVGTQIKLDLSWLTDALFVVTYDATVEYCYAK
jgi:hypothetical protein